MGGVKNATIGYILVSRVPCDGRILSKPIISCSYHSYLITDMNVNVHVQLQNAYSSIFPEIGYFGLLHHRVTHIGLHVIKIPIRPKKLKNGC